MIKKLQKDWFDLGEKYTSDIMLLESIWNKILKHYSKKNRYYHNLNHIKSMLVLAEKEEALISNFNSLKFAIWFHDIIYKSTSKKNEELSAIAAKKELNYLGLGQIQIRLIENLILSTKSHKIILEENNDNAYLLDFDLAILGQDWNIYQEYLQKIRKEYKIYPDFLYNPARIKVLISFLDRDNLFFTKKYQKLYEVKARENLKREIENLS